MWADLEVWDPAAGRRVCGTESGWFGFGGFTPDGKSLLTWDDRIVTFWDAATGAKGRALPAFPDALRALALTPDGRTLAAGTASGEIILHDLGGERPRQVLRRHDREVHHLAFSPDGRRLTSADHLGFVRTHDLTRPAVHRLEGAANSLEPGPRLATISWPPGSPRDAGTPTVAVTDKDSGAEAFRRRLDFPGEVVRFLQVQVSGDGRRVAAQYLRDPRRVLYKWDESAMLRAAAALPTPPAGLPGALETAVSWWRFLPWREEVRVWDVASGREVFARSWFVPWPQANDPPQLSPSGRHLLTSGSDGRWAVIDLATGRECVAGRSEAGSTRVAYLGDEAVTVSELRALGKAARAQPTRCVHSFRRWDLATGRASGSREFEYVGLGDAEWLTSSPDGRRFGLTVSPEGPSGRLRVLVWEVRADGSFATLLDVMGGSTQRSNGLLTFSPDGRRVALSAMGEVLVWNLDAGGEPTTLRGVVGSPELAFSPGGDRLCGLDASPYDPPLARRTTLKVWDLAGGRELLELPLDVPATSLRFEGDRLYLLNSDQKTTTLTVLDGSPP
jgi:WD40 repeat protein